MLLLFTIQYFLFLTLPRQIIEFLLFTIAVFFFVMQSTLYVFSLLLVFFLPRDHGLDSDISLYEDSINQSVNQPIWCYFSYTVVKIVIYLSAVFVHDLFCLYKTLDEDSSD